MKGQAAYECDKLFENKNIISNVDMGRSMQNKIYEKLELERAGMRVVLEFPQDTKDEEYIKEEVKSILSIVLQEQYENLKIQIEKESDNENSKNAITC